MLSASEFWHVILMEGARMKVDNWEQVSAFGRVSACRLWGIRVVGCYVRDPGSVLSVL